MSGVLYQRRPLLSIGPNGCPETVVVGLEHRAGGDVAWDGELASGSLPRYHAGASDDCWLLK